VSHKDSCSKPHIGYERLHRTFAHFQYTDVCIGRSLTLDHFDIEFLGYQVSYDIGHQLCESTAAECGPTDIAVLICDYRRFPPLLTPERHLDQNSPAHIPPLPDPSSVLVIIFVAESEAKSAPYGFMDRSIVSSALAGVAVHRGEGERLIQMKGILKLHLRS